MPRKRVTTNEIMASLTELTEFLQEHMLTREEAFGTFATKEDLKAFATKEDLKAFATKEDLKAFATKDDLYEGLRETENRLMIHIDGLIVMHRRHDDEIFANRSRLERVADGLNDTRRHSGLEPVVV